jgi:dienelactone hydrolase
MSSAQVKSNYLYSTSMPYGTLDIRTKISASNYFYLQEGKTFSFRESSPGVRTNSYMDMTSFESKPYGQGNLRRKNGTSDQFIMNYRLLPPLNYNAAYAEGYPLMLLLHGAVERANCYYNNCYHSGWSYDPNVNNPPAPKTATHKLLNNDHNLSQGAKGHMDARNKAAGKMPNDPTVVGKMFPGFVVAPQMFNVWDANNVQDVIRLVQLIAQKYNIDENRIYVHGLSIGGYAVYEALKRAPWLFAAAQPMSAVDDAGIRQHNQTAKVVHIPIWAFQGGTDKAPTPAYTSKLVTDFNNAGAVMKYTVYAGVGHTCWHKAFAEADFYPWMLRQTKSNIHASKGITAIKGTAYPKLMMAEGFFKYQWEKDGKIVSGSSNTYIAKAPGKYRARFSRVAAPTASQWNKWSNPITITTSTGRMATDGEAEEVSVESEFVVNTYPNPASAEGVTITVESPDRTLPVHIKFIDQMGRSLYDRDHNVDELAEGVTLSFPSPTSGGVYILIANQGARTVRKKVAISK